MAANTYSKTPVTPPRRFSEINPWSAEETLAYWQHSEPEYAELAKAVLGMNLPPETLAAPLKHLPQSAIPSLAAAIREEVKQQKKYHDIFAYRTERVVGDLMVKECPAAKSLFERRKGIYWSSHEMLPILCHWEVCYGDQIPLTVRAATKAIDGVLDKDSDKKKDVAFGLYPMVTDGSIFLHRALNSRFPLFVADSSMRECGKEGLALTRGQTAYIGNQK